MPVIFLLLHEAWRPKWRHGPTMEPSIHSAFPIGCKGKIHTWSWPISVSLSWPITYLCFAESPFLQIWAIFFYSYINNDLQGYSVLFSFISHNVNIGHFGLFQSSVTSNHIFLIFISNNLWLIHFSNLFLAPRLCFPHDPLCWRSCLLGFNLGSCSFSFM